MAYSYPALGLIETNSIARGIVVNDAMSKKAPVHVLESHTICPGKYLVVITGDVADVEEAMQAGIHYAGHTLVDHLFLPQAHDQLSTAIAGTASVDQIESVGIVETYTVAAALLAGDAAAKAAEVTLTEMRLSNGLGGKAFFILTGELNMVEAAVAAACNAIDGGLLVQTEIIAAPHADLERTLA